MKPQPKTAQPALAAPPSSAYPWEDAYESLIHALKEEAANLERVINDEDSCCASRELRRARLSGIQHALAVADTLSRWEW